MATFETFSEIVNAPLSLDPQVVSALGRTLIHFVWQGLAIAILLRLTLSFLRGALARYNAASLAMAIMALVPLVTFWSLYSQSTHEVVTAPGLERAGALALQTINLATTTVRGPGVPVLPESGFRWTSVDAAPLCVAIWLAGVALLSLRSLGGWLILRRLRRQCELLPREVRKLCRALCDGLGITRPIGFFAARGVDAPAVIGWFKPIVLLPVSALTGLDPVQLEAVIAHELAHIKRHDAFVNLFQIAMETVFFYHPAVWWTSRLIRQERELCCDDIAVAVSGEVLPYAKALALMEEWRQMPDLAMAVNSQPLKSRIARLLGGSVQNMTRFPAPTMLLMLVLATTSAALLARPLLTGTLRQTVNQIEERYIEQAATAQPIARRPPAAEAPAPASNHQSMPAPTPAPVPEAWPSFAPAPAKAPAPLLEINDSAAFPTPAPAPASNHQPMLAPAPAPMAKALPSSAPTLAEAPEAPLNFAQSDDQGAATSSKHGSYIAEMEAAGYKNLTVDELVALKVQGVTGDYVQQIRSAGLSPNVNQLIGLKVQGVTPEYIRQMSAAGLSTDIHSIIGMKVQGITPEYLKEIRASGLNPTTNELIAMKVQGVTPEYVKEVRAAGWPSATVNDVVAMKVQGVKPSDAAEFKKLGFQDITLHQLIGFKVQDLTPAYIQAMRVAGFKSDSIHDYMSAKIQGVTPEFAEKAKQHGFKDLDLHKLIALKMADVL